jgi:hypothetical protein
MPPRRPAARFHFIAGALGLPPNAKISGGKSMKLAALALCAALTVATAGWAAAAGYFAYNLTATTSFSGVYLAPAGGTRWGPNQALNDDDKVLDFGERLTLTGVAPGIYDVKLVDDTGRTCILHGVDLKTQTSFEIRDAGLTDCK